MRRIPVGCCVWAVSGHAAAAPPRTLMNSRRLMELLRAADWDVLPYTTLRTKTVPRASPKAPPLVVSGWGQSLPKRDVRAASAFPLIATEERTSCDVSNVPQADVP